jgi:hypothetical protein
MLDEFHRVALRKKIYAAIEDLQTTDLDLCMSEFNEARPRLRKMARREDADPEFPRIPIAIENPSR